MESPPSISTWSEAFILSDDSGLLLTNSSISSGSMSGDGRSGRKLPLEFLDSDCDDKSLSQDDSLDGMSDIMCGENFNTLKKGANWIEYKHSIPIEPPPEFQDKPSPVVDVYCNSLSMQILNTAVNEYRETELQRLKTSNHFNHFVHLGHHLWTCDFIPFSPCHIARPNSRCSLGSSRLSSSHNSLSVPPTQKVDDSSFITQAVSHDTLSSHQISDLYNVPFDSDIYAVPVDVVKPPLLKPKRNQQHKKRRRYTSSACSELEARQCQLTSNASKTSMLKLEQETYFSKNDTKRHSVAGTSARIEGEPIHMTLQEVRKYLQTLYSSSSDSSEHKEKDSNTNTMIYSNNNNKYSIKSNNNGSVADKNFQCTNNNNSKKNTLLNIKNKKVKDSCDTLSKQIVIPSSKDDKKKKSSAKFLSFKQTLYNMFKFKKISSSENNVKEEYTKEKSNTNDEDIEDHNTIVSRALPPLPSKEKEREVMEEQSLDFATSIQRVKDYGWYWGPLSGEAAEKILSNEPDGSFIVRDSSDDHYIFSLTFKLNDCVRHVRIEHDKGNFSFGSCTKFKSQTIVEFIENAVEHSRSGRYLFFLHRRPVIGPVRVQLLHPVSRFKQVQSLQHMCRFVIHKEVRRDLISSLPLPRRIIDYLNTPHYYSEHLVEVESNSDEQNHPTSISEQAEDVYEQENILADVPANDYVVLNNRHADNTRQS